MAKRILSLTLCVLILACAPGLATGTNADPAVTKSYIDQVYLPRLTEYASGIIKPAPETDAAFQDLFRQIEARNDGTELRSTAARDVSKAMSFQTAAFRTLAMNAGDTLRGGDGTMFMLRSGSAQATGELIELTTGTVIFSGCQIPTGVLLCAESDSGIVVRVAGSVMIKGNYRYILPPDERYAEEAEALRSMGLISGTNSGLELTRPLTRAEGLALMLILFGEGATALGDTGTAPFTDIQGHWAERYIIYAYNRGYTAGTSATAFSPENFFSADMFVTLVLAALGHDKSSDFFWKNALEYAAAHEIISAGQIEPARDFFNRDQLMHIGYQTLSARFKGSDETVLDRLLRQGVIDPQKAATALGISVPETVSEVAPATVETSPAAASDMPASLTQ